MKKRPSGAESDWKAGRLSGVAARGCLSRTLAKCVPTLPGRRIRASGPYRNNCVKEIGHEKCNGIDLDSTPRGRVRCERGHSASREEASAASAGTGFSAAGQDSAELRHETASDPGPTAIAGKICGAGASDSAREIYMAAGRRRALGERIVAACFRGKLRFSAE